MKWTCENGSLVVSWDYWNKGDGYEHQSLNVRSGAELAAGDVEVGEIIVCPCGVELEVLSVDPVTVGPAPEEGEDWGE